MAPPGGWGRNRLGVGAGRGVFSSLSPLAERGALHSVLRPKPLARPPSPLQHLAQGF